MSKAKSRRHPARAAPRPPSHAVALRLSPLAWWRLWQVIGWTTTLGVLAWGLVLLRAWVHAQRPHTPITLTFHQPPPTAEIEAEILAAANLGSVLAQSVFAPELVARLGAGLAQSPWVADVRRVSRRPTGEVVVEATFRLPFAYVDAGPDMLCLIDAEGYRLPWTYTRKQIEEGAQWVHWFCIVGVDAPPPPPGQRWTPRSHRGAAMAPDEPPLAPDLAAGIRLARFLHEAHARDQAPFRPLLRAIDVANYDLRQDAWAGRLRLRTISTRSMIHWGLPPGEESGTEPDAQQKLDRLRRFFNQEGGQFPSGFEYDVRPDGGVKSYEFRGR